MFGITINNRIINELVDSGSIKIDSFDKKKLKNIHYPLHVGKVLTHDSSRKWKVAHSFDDNDKPFELLPNQYVQVVIKEQIQLSKGLVGEFIPTSNLIDDGISLTAGRIEYPFGNEGEYIHFGLKNLLDVNFEIPPSYRIAYLKFIDVRGLSSDRIHLSKEEVRRHMQRLVGVKRDMEADGGAMHDDDVEYFIDFG